ncbi:MAG: 16S rRNA (guanine(527)-N(7))-methyltransferase RsmG [Candidatus Caenarcaniphilales bacterium]|nr:16S rRNA (guanine(527)-N(7))-methyltransferase RsmG [Candidatus Caenarcaniphilales bacterium]
MSLLNKYLDDFEKIYELYQGFNSYINISAIREKEEVFEKHFLDALEAWDLIESCLNQQESTEKPFKILDLGTGGGFPLIPLALVAKRENLNIRFTALDSVAKKLKFIEIIKEKLGLDNIETQAARAEDIARIDSPQREVYDMVLCRSVAYLNIILELAAPLLRIKGNFLAFKQLGENEFADAKNAIEILKFKLMQEHKYSCSGLDKALLVFEKQGRTDAKYPRLYSQIKSKAL